MSSGMYQALDVDVPASNNTGEPLAVDGLTDKWVQLMGTFTATVSFEVSFDGGTTYQQVGVSMTTPGLLEIPQPATHLHAVTTGFMAGTPKAKLRAFNHNL